MAFPRSDIYFAADDAHTFLPWLVGIMAFLATLLLCLGTSIGGWVSERGQSYGDSFTVNIPANVSNMESALGDMVEALKKNSNVDEITRVSDAELQDMLKPWLGGSAAAGELPLPVVLDVRLANPKEKMDYDGLQKTLAAIAPGTEIDAHELWVAAFLSFSGAVQSLMVILALLIAGGMALMIAFTSKAALKLHSRTVQLLHSIGAEDGYISRQFQMQALLLVLPGALLGSVLAGGAYWLCGLYIASLQTSIMPSLAMNNAHLALLLALPLACCLLAWGVARMAVIQQLGRSL